MLDAVHDGTVLFMSSIADLGVNGSKGGVWGSCGVDILLWCASGVLGLEVWRSGVLEYLRTYSVLLRFGGDGTLISSNAGVSRRTHQDTPGHARTRQATLGHTEAALLLARRHKGKGSVSESRKGGAQDRERGGGSEACED
jgi:hypothetical protein